MPKIKSASSPLSTITVLEESKYYLWPPSSRGEIILNQKDYKKVTERLLALQFRSEEAAVASTKTWIDEVAVLAGRGGGWGQAVVGRKEPATVTSDGTGTPVNGGAVNTLGVKRKSDAIAETQPAANGSSAVNTLGSGLVKKKKKIQPQQV
jgi:regulator of Ty1 transposition protein 109